MTPIYAIGLLNQETKEEKLSWRTKGSENDVESRYVADTNRADPGHESVWRAVPNVHMELWKVVYRGISQVTLELSSEDLGTISILQPTPTGMFGKKYTSDDVRDLAELMETFYKLVAAQCAARRRKEAATEEERTQKMFRRLAGFK